MCLNLRKDYRKKYRKDNIRWKIALINPCQDVNSPLIKLVSYYRGYMYDLGKWIKAFNRSEIRKYNKHVAELPHRFRNWRRKFGYHVFLSKNSAKRRLDRVATYQNVLMKLECKEFIASGYFHKTKSETYKYIRVIEVLDCKGKSLWKIKS